MLKPAEIEALRNDLLKFASAKAGSLVLLPCVQICACNLILAPCVMSLHPATSRHQPSLARGRRDLQARLARRRKVERGRVAARRRAAGRIAMLRRPGSLPQCHRGVLFQPGVRERGHPARTQARAFVSCSSRHRQVRSLGMPWEFHVKCHRSLERNVLLPLFVVRAVPRSAQSIHVMVLFQRAVNLLQSITSAASKGGSVRLPRLACALSQRAPFSGLFACVRSPAAAGSQGAGGVAGRGRGRAGLGVRRGRLGRRAAVSFSSRCQRPRWLKKAQHSWRRACACVCRRRLCCSLRAIHPTDESPATTLIQPGAAWAEVLVLSPLVELLVATYCAVRAREGREATLMERPLRCLLLAWCLCLATVLLLRTSLEVAFDHHV